MATGFPEVDTGILNCSICLEKFNNPKYLPCLHTFCESCLQSYIVSTVKKTEKNGDSFTCPICRIAVKPLDSKSSAEKWAAQMPNNHLIFSMLDSFPLKDEDSKRNCDPCKLSNETTDAKYWCIECMEALCEVCYSFHRRLKMTKHHKVVSVTEIENCPLKMAWIDEPCQEHRGKVYEVYCLDHGSLCCVICLATKHRECKNIKTIDEMSEEVKESDLSKFAQQLEDTVNKTTIMVNNKQKNIDDIDKKYTDLLGSLTETVSEAKTKLDQLLGKVKYELEQLHKPHRQNLVDRKERIESFMKTVVNGLKLIQAVSGQGTNKQIFLSAEKVKSQLNSHIKQLQSELSDDQKVDYCMKVDENLRNIGAVMTSLAKVKVTSSTQSEISPVIVSVQSLQLLSQQNKESDIMDLEAVCVAEIRSEGSDFTSGAFLDSGKIVFVDYNEQKLKVYDITWRLLSETRFNRQPWNVTSLSGDDILISMDASGGIFRYRILPTNMFLKVSYQQFEKATEGLSLSVSKQNICVADKSKVHLVSEKGEITKSFYRVFPDTATYVASTVDSVYFIDGESLVCYDVDGKETFRHQHSDLKVARGIAIDSNKNVYVCIPAKGYIYLISNSGSRGREFVLELGDMKKPYAIGFDKEGEHFFVTSDGEKTTAKIFKLVRKSDQ